MGYNNSVRLVTFFSDKRREAVEIIAQRVFNPLYIHLDICFLVFFCALLIVRKKYLALFFALACSA